jgi:Xaa-Pro aminopeptidase
MREDIDRFMQERALDALFIAGAPTQNPAMAYFTGAAHITNAYVLKRRGLDPLVMHYAMEREEAARAGYPTKNLSAYNLIKLLDEADGDRIAANVKLLQLVFEELELRGRVGIYGKADIGHMYAVLLQLSQKLEGVEFVGEASVDSVLSLARTTKDDDEVARIRRMGEITTAVVSDVAGFLTSHHVEDGTLVDREGQPLTVGEVKRRINLWLAMRGAENPHGTIFAVGRDAGIPHSVGSDSDTIPIGVPIVFDLYPVEAGGGYYFDHTRTWCLDHAPENVETVYQDVLEVYEKVLAAFTPGVPCREYQLMTCELFEGLGHKSIMNDPNTEEGYVHSLGHGLGLAVHERPTFSLAESNLDVLEPGCVITHEPGLYYPEDGLGVRIEDTFYVQPDGEIVPLSDYPKDLVLKMRSA